MPRLLAPARSPFPSRGTSWRRWSGARRLSPRRPSLGEACWPPWCPRSADRWSRITGFSPRTLAGDRPSCRSRRRPTRGRRRRFRAAGPGPSSCAGCLRSRSRSVPAVRSAPDCGHGDRARGRAAPARRARAGGPAIAGPARHCLVAHCRSRHLPQVTSGARLSGDPRGPSSPMSPPSSPRRGGARRAGAGGGADLPQPPRVRPSSQPAGGERFPTPAATVQSFARTGQARR